MDKLQILEYLKKNCQGHDKAITGEQLRFLSGCRDVRTVQETIQELRKEKQPIMFNCGSMPGPKGYFYASNHDEGITYLQPLKNHIKNTQETLHNLLVGIEDTFGKGA
jgi:predicted deacylase